MTDASPTMPDTLAMRVHAPNTALTVEHIHLPPLREHELLIAVTACGVCRTDLHLIDGELSVARYPVTPGHEIVGRVVATGSEVSQQVGDRVGVPWLAGSCGHCPFCRQDQENLCVHAQFTGATRDGGYAEYAVADARYCLQIPARYSDAEAAPLLCAGLIGYRAWRAAGPAYRLGLYGFGAAAHLVAQMAIYHGQQVFAFTRPGDAATQEFARRLGVTWAGGSDQPPYEPLDASILFAPVGSLVPAALGALRAGGRVVCAGIHMSDIPSFPYSLLWGERSICSVANLTRGDGREFMKLAGQIDLRPSIQTFALQDANQALDQLRRGVLQGAAVLIPGRQQ